MLWNNLALLSAWALMSWWCGAGLFFVVYVLSVSVAGGLGIVLFTVQHNFEHAYATDCVTGTMTPVRSRARVSWCCPPG